jgi:hypothetical protein
MLTIRGIISFHATNFSPIRSLRQEKLKGEELSTCATLAYATLYGIGTDIDLSKTMYPTIDLLKI